MLEGKEIDMRQFKNETIIPAIDLATGAGLGPFQNKELIGIWRVAIQFAYKDALINEQQAKIIPKA